MFNKVRQIVIAVNNLNDAVKAYENLGFKVSKSGTEPKLGLKNAYLPIGESLLELVEPLDPTQGPIAKAIQTRGEGLYMLEFEVDNVDKAIQELKSKGVRIIGDDPKTRGPMVFIHPASTKGVLIAIVQKA